ncbi:MAG: Rab family GTPase [Candidatus Hodarchaeales archaeon]|jgi:small GTP-binding protein
MGFFRKKKKEEKLKEKPKKEELERVSRVLDPAAVKSTKDESSSSSSGEDVPRVRRRRRRSTSGRRERAVTGKKVDFFMKMILCGDGAVGKTALRQRFLGKGFSSSYLQTIGADFASIDKTISVPGVGEKQVKYQVWDLAGQQEFQAVRSSYYEGCFGALMVFDLTRPSSFENIPVWISELWNNSQRGQVPVVLLGNKADLKDKFPEHVTDEAINSYTEKINEEVAKYKFTVPYLETSALTGKNVDEAFKRMGESIISWIEHRDK